MFVAITRDCQINGLFYSKWDELHIDDDQFHADCMVQIPHKRKWKSADQETQSELKKSRK